MPIDQSVSSLSVRDTKGVSNMLTTIRRRASGHVFRLNDVEKCVGRLLVTNKGGIAKAVRAKVQTWLTFDPLNLVMTTRNRVDTPLFSTLTFGFKSSCGVKMRKTMRGTVCENIPEYVAVFVLVARSLDLPIDITTLHRPTQLTLVPREEIPVSPKLLNVVYFVRWKALLDLHGLSEREHDANECSLKDGLHFVY